MTNTNEIIIAIISSIAGSSAVFAFLQFLIERKDRNSKRYNILTDSIDRIDKKVDNLDNKIDKNEAINARTRVLRASDELRCDIKHSQEFFDQLHEDINIYQRYCSEHPEFKNNKATNAISVINDIYAYSIRSNDFL